MEMKINATNHGKLNMAGNVMNYIVPDGSVTSEKLADGSVTSEKLADGSVTDEKIANGAISSSKFSEDCGFYVFDKATEAANFVVGGVTGIEIAPLDDGKVPADFLPITQTTGQSESDVMSQKAVTDELNQTNRSLDYLWKISKGKLYDTEIVTSYAANVSAPSGAMQYAQLHKLGGSTLLFNQLVTNGNFQDLSNWDVYKGTGSVSNNVLTVTGATGRGGVRQNVHKPVYAGHIYYLSCTYTSTKGFTIKPFSASSYYLNVPAQEEPTYANARFTASSDTTTTFDMFPTTSSEVGDFTISNLMLTDLTQMFGAGSEPTAEEFRSILRWDYYDYIEIKQINSPVYTIRSEQSLIEYDIPEEIRSLDGYGEGYGDSYNYVDFVEKKFYRVGEFIDKWITYDEPIITDISAFLPDDFDIIDIVDDAGVVSFYCYDEDFNLPVHSEIEFMIDIAEVV